MLTSCYIDRCRGGHPRLLGHARSVVGALPTHKGRRRCQPVPGQLLCCALTDGREVRPRLVRLYLHCLHAHKHHLDTRMHAVCCAGSTACRASDKDGDAPHLGAISSEDPQRRRSACVRGTGAASGGWQSTCELCSVCLRMLPPPLALRLLFGLKSGPEVWLCHLHSQHAAQPLASIVLRQHMTL